MTSQLDIANRSLQFMGARTNMTQSEFVTNGSNEAIQCNLIMNQLRDELNRMAPWDCTTKWANLTYVTSVSGTPENPNSGPPLWVPGLPAPPWAYEYQYPVDCMRMRMIVPQYTSQAGGIPIYPSGIVTGASQIGWTGPPLKFKVATDGFYGVTAAAVASGGTGAQVGDIITLVQPTFTPIQGGQSYPMSVGAPAQLLITGAVGGVVTTVSVINQVQGEATPIGGSYFSIPSNPVAQGSTTGLGAGATFNLTFGAAAPQRVILCNQEQGIGCYNTQIVDPNVMDQLFQDAWVHLLGSRLALQLAGDKALANQLLGLTNNAIAEARKVDGNEGITVNDVMPDFLRVRGNYGGPNWEFSPNNTFDWGGFFSPY